MSRTSLRLRLLVVSAALIAAALALAGFGLTMVFQSALDQRAAQELTQHIRLLAGHVGILENGRISLDQEPSDPRFLQPYGGLYWQISSEGREPLRSRSLWDTTLAMPVDALPGNAIHIHHIDGPRKQALVVAERSLITRGRDGSDVGLRINVALDQAELDPLRTQFAALLWPSMAILGVVLVGAMSLMLGYALAPFRDLRSALMSLHSGRTRQIDNRYPDEVRPVVEELNRFIRREDEALGRARAQAGDLAHGLKTPLAILGKIARDAEAAGNRESAREIETQVSMMEQHVVRALARSRAGLNAVLAYQRTSVADVAGKLVGALQRLPRPDAADGAGTLPPLRWSVMIPVEARFQGDETDLFEILGNLVDNARKWARSEVSVSAIVTRVALVIKVEDDGPGMPTDAVGDVVRGRRLDEAMPGTGFGLAIAKDLVEAYGGTLALRTAPLGGLSVVLTFPLMGG